MKEMTSKLKRGTIRIFLICAQIFLPALTATLGPGAHAQTVTYIHTDGLGSPVAKSDATGNLVPNNRTRYEPYGMEVAGTATPTIGFTGHVNDSDTGLIYMQQRYYDPVAGRFLSTDPVIADQNTAASFNRYTYALNSPYKNIDPDGREAIGFEACLGFCGGITIGYSRESREFAITLNGGAGMAIDAGFSIDPRGSENGRMQHLEGSSPTRNQNSTGGLTLAAYAKASVSALLWSEGKKVGGGYDLVKGQLVGGESREVGISKVEQKQIQVGAGFNKTKVGVGANASGGLEGSIYVDVGKVKQKISNVIDDALVRITPKFFR